MLPLAAGAPLAPHFVGVVLATTFYGITLAQAFAYYRTYTTDPRHMKFIVAFLLLLDTSQVFLAFTSIYGYTIRWRGDESALLHVSGQAFSAFTWPKLILGLLDLLLVPWPSQSVSAGNAYLTTSIIALAFVALAMTAKTLRNPRWDETRVSNLPAALILASTVTCDLLIASAQVWLFHRHRLKRGKLFSFKLRRRGTSVRPGTEETQVDAPSPPGGSSRRGSVLAGIAGLAGSWRMGSSSGSGPGSTVTAEVDKEHAGVEGCEDGDHDGCRLGALLTTLTLLVVNVGLLTSLDATLFLVLFLTCPRNGTFLVPYILLSNCYVNSFLSILNSRRILRDLVENPEHFPVTFDFALDIDTG
ncbi:hypothetical protein DFH07DRAFT_1000944 [Mycena maculata]|uniref:DUF6534 domain-containing protein n=1 Tax=Mycena maculata TaxID=230809 RepID=A0AAD7NQM8_9AGAR|nr:hypothetical protein DFH07DRAFT_1000944 [Mycena maculata]